MKTLETAHHITCNGVPYCQCEGREFFGTYRYPTCCGHASREDAEEGAEACRKLRPDVVFAVVPGPCHDDRYWETPAGIAARELEDELDRMRLEAYDD